MNGSDECGLQSDACRVSSAFCIHHSALARTHASTNSSRCSQSHFTPIAATLPDGRVIAGTVDRLCIGEKLVRVIDFKTGRNVPSGLAEVPPAHRAQMEAYAEALRVIFPGRAIEASLLYTSGPKLISLTG